jgi:uncharacterized protein
MHQRHCRIKEFIPQATAGQLADILRKRFADRMDQNPSEEEVRSWKNSLGAFADAIDGVGMDEAWIILEYQLPLASTRIDAMVVGSDQNSKQNAVLLEFKQWDRCQVTDSPDLVQIGIGEALHPSAQVRGYRQYLEDAHSAFSTNSVFASSCAYLHNVKTIGSSSFYDVRYAELLDDSPIFCLENVNELARFVGEPTRFGASADLVNSVLKGKYLPSKKLLDHVADSIAGYEPWKLLDDQRVTFAKIFEKVEKARTSDQKCVFVVKGGPGTGKSVIALQVVGAAARKGYNVVHATGSKAFTINLRGIVNKPATFRYFFNLANLSKNSLDLTVCDEAHRLRQRSDQGRFKVISDRPQEQDIIDASKIAVFLMDDQQSVRANETGSIANILAYAQSQNVPAELIELTTQFCMAGSDSYFRWIQYVFGFSENRALAWKRNHEYDVRIFDRVEDMESALKSQMTESNSARLVAGFCWEWSDPLADGYLVPDVKIGSWARPWNKKPRDMWRTRSGADPLSRHPYKLWATMPASFDEVGCIYSAQGFEFDYVGVIVGADLKWDESSHSWQADLSKNSDAGFKNGVRGKPELAAEKLRQVYRVLSTRGMKGTYFYFLDEATQRHFEQAGAV